MSLPLMKVAPARTKATRCGALTMRQWSWADSMSLKAMASPAAREPGPLVTLVRCRTVANVDNDAVGRVQQFPHARGEGEERDEPASVTSLGLVSAWRA